MRLFIYKSFLFLCSLLLILLIPPIVYFFQMRGELTAYEGVRTLVLGDSHTQNGVNDKQLKQSINVSSSGESYIYSFIKLKHLLRSNNNIENLVLAFAPHNFDTEVDSLWLYDNSNVLKKVGSLYPFIRKEEWQFLIRNKLLAPVTILQKIFYESIYSVEVQMIMRKMPFVGGYTPNDKKFSCSDMPNDYKLPKPSEQLSKPQLLYFNKIRDLCRANDIKLYLINTPTYTEQKLFPISKLIQPDEVLLDWSRMPLSEKYFADCNHLNPLGAQYITDSLSKILY